MVEQNGETGDAPTDGRYGVEGPQDGARLRSRTRWHLTMITLMQIANAALGVFSVYFIFAIEQIVEMIPADRDAAIAFGERLDLIGLVAGLGFIAIYLIFTVVYFAWLYLAVGFAGRRAPEQMITSPGWAVGWHLIPIANIIVMPQIWHRLCRAATAGPAPTGLILLWLLPLLLSSGLSNAAFRMASGNPSVEQLRTASTLDAASSVLTLLSLLALSTLVRRTAGAFDAIDR